VSLDWYLQDLGVFTEKVKLMRRRRSPQLSTFSQAISSRKRELKKAENLASHSFDSLGHDVKRFEADAIENERSRELLLIKSPPIDVNDLEAKLREEPLTAQSHQRETFDSACEGN